jgi:glyoxylate reductase
MMELFPHRLNLNDKPFGKCALIVAGGQAEILVPTFAAESMAGARRRDGIKTSRRDFRLQALDNVARLPHIGAATIEGRAAMGERGEHQQQDLIGGYRPLDRVIGFML